MTTTKAIISVAGYGTRRLPITKTIEKCMLPFGNRPVVDYIVSDCVAAGITDIYLVITKGSQQLQDYFGNNTRLERYLKANNKDEALKLIENYEGVNFHFIEQDTENGQYGTTIPPWLCREYISPDETVLIVMGDDTTYSLEGESDIERLLSQGNGCAMLGIPVAREKLPAYGVLGFDENDVFTHIHEKPTVEEAPSNLANFGRYVLPGTFMQFLDDAVKQGPNEKGEYFITDPINVFTAAGNAISVIETKGHYMDSGSVQNWVEANQWLLENNAL